MPIRISGMNSGLDTEALVSALTSGYKTKVDNAKKAQTKISWKQDAWKNTNKKIYSLYTSISNLRFTSAYQAKKTSVSDTTKASVTASSQAAIGTHTLEVKDLASTAYLTGAKLTSKDAEGKASTAKGSTKLSELGYDVEDGNTISFTYNGKKKDISVSKNSTVNDFVNALKDAGVQANFDEANGRIFVAAQKSGASYDFSFDEGGADTTDASKSALKALGLVSAPDGSSSADSGYAVKIKGADAKITLDGATYTGSTNDFSINGINISATGKTTAPVTITTSQDTQGLYDKVKDFLTQYNEVINDLTASYNAASAKGYEPLTDEQKASMSDTEVEKWEDKIKASLLRRDGTLDGVINTMTNAMSKSYKVGNKMMSWSTFGVHTLGFLNSAENEQNAYHIDGDEDDSLTSGNADKLMAALTRDPDSVIDFMQQSVSGLYKGIDQKMKSTSMRSAYTVYNDKEMASEYSDYSDVIKQWTTRLTEMEDKYYKQFANMEKQLAALQSNSSSLTGMMG